MTQVVIFGLCLFISLSAVQGETCAGCPIEVDPKDAGITPWVGQTLKASNSNSGDNLRLVRIRKVTKQVVAGVKYTVDLEVNKDGKNCVRQCQIVYLSQPWKSAEPQLLRENCTDTEPTRNTRQVLGGLKDIEDDEMPTVQKLTEYVLKTLDEIDTDNTKQVVAKILKAKKQLVDGLMYHVEVLVTSTSCEEDKETTDDCVKDEVAPPKLCKLQIHRSWADKSPVNAKVVKSECSPRQRRLLVGGLNPVRENSEAVLKAAELAVDHLNEMSNSLYVLKLISINKASTQVVAGTNTYLTIEVGNTDCHKNTYKAGDECKLDSTQDPSVCKVVVYEKPWANLTKVTSATCQPKKSTEPRVRRGVPGGINPISNDHEWAKQAANLALADLDAKSNSNYKTCLHQIISASTQVVAGQKNTVTFRVGESNCSKDKDCIVTTCENSNPTQECTYTVMIRSWLKTEEIVDGSCRHIGRSKRSETPLLGGVTPVTADNESAKRAVKVGLADLDIKSNSNYKTCLHKIVSASTQVVSGQKTTVTFQVGESNCAKGKNCESTCTNNNPTQECTYVIWSQPWLNKENVIEARCNNIGRSKRDLVGADKPVDVSENRIVNLIPFVAQEVTLRANSEHTKSIVRVVSATTKVVSGTLTTMTVVVGDTGCLKSENKPLSECQLASSNEQDYEICVVKIWEQVWNNKREVTESDCHKNQTVTGSNGKESGVLHRKRKGLRSEEDDPLSGNFLEFMKKHRKVYGSRQELLKRFRIFRANMRKVAYLQKTEQGSGQYGATEMADLTSSEFKARYLGLKPKMEIRHKYKPREMATIPNISLPDTFDWRDYNAVTEVKNQGGCGSCWAFSVTGNIEGQYAIKNSQLLSLSEQELVDCDKYDNGCEGGLFDTAYHAIEELGGLELENDYPYGGLDEKCRFNSSEVRVSISGAVNISHDETDMAKWLVANGPISVALNANAMQFYMGGVSKPIKFLCDPKSLDHGVLIVGYGVHKGWITHKNLPYWIVKNSWGHRWGKQGYYWLYRGEGSCGINQMPSSAVL